MSLLNCRVVLVRPQVAGNLGATARVMRNMGLTDLVLVAPEVDPSDRNARQLSTHGEEILDRAQAVPVCLYEMRVAWLDRTSTEATGIAVPFAEQERMFEHLRTALEEIHFLYGDKAETLMHALRHLIGRSRPSPMEVDVLFGLARQLRWYVANHSPRP